MNIKDLSIIELKAMAYDHVSLIERSQQTLMQINAELRARVDVSTEEPKPDA